MLHETHYNFVQQPCLSYLASELAERSNETRPQVDEKHLASHHIVQSACLLAHIV
jgi:hypothetical protein